MKIQYKTIFLTLSTALFISGCQSIPQAQQYNVDINTVDATGIGKKIGTVTFTDTSKGLMIQPHLKDLPVGQRGFHIHENASCEPDFKDGQSVAALKAGSHFDPKLSQTHLGPIQAGHLGDLPFLMVDANGTATTAVVAPRLTIELIKNRSIMVHAGGDNYSDQPAALGGGGARIACGVIL